MEVILLEKSVSWVVLVIANVKAGFGRNYLIPWARLFSPLKKISPLSNCVEQNLKPTLLTSWFAPRPEQKHLKLSAQ